MLVDGSVSGGSIVLFIGGSIAEGKEGSPLLDKGIVSGCRTCKQSVVMTGFHGCFSVQYQGIVPSDAGFQSGSASQMDIAAAKRGSVGYCERSCLDGGTSRVGIGTAQNQFTAAVFHKRQAPIGRIGIFTRRLHLIADGTVEGIGKTTGNIQSQCVAAFSGADITGARQPFQRSIARINNEVSLGRNQFHLRGREGIIILQDQPARTFFCRGGRLNHANRSFVVRIGGGNDQFVVFLPGSVVLNRRVINQITLP